MALPLLICGQHTPADNCGLLVAVAFVANVVLVGTLLHLLNQFVPRPDRVFLYGILMHVIALT
jgi:hypothetical protein